MQLNENFTSIYLRITSFRVATPVPDVSYDQSSIAVSTAFLILLTHYIDDDIVF